MFCRRLKRSLTEFMQSSNNGAALILRNCGNYCRRTPGVNEVCESFSAKDIIYAVDYLWWAGWMSHYSLQHVEELVEPHPIQYVILILHQIFDVIRGIKSVDSFQQNFCV